MGFAIRSRRVLFEEQGKLVIRPALIQVTGTQISRVEKLTPDDYERNRSNKLPRLIDLHDQLLTPAFVNAHTHLALAFLRGVETESTHPNLVEDLFFRHESRLTREDVRAFTRMGAYESLLAGVGFVWDHYYGDTAMAEALAEVGMAGVVSPTLQDLAGPDARGSEVALEATLGIAGSEHYREKAVFAALGPHATDTVSAGLFRRIAELAEQHALPVHLHVAQSSAEVARVHEREGCSPLALLTREGVLARAPRVVMAHGLFAPRADVAALDADRHTLVHCPSSQLEFGFPGPATMWSELGASWVIATDCAASNDSMSLQKELRLTRGAPTAAISGSAAYERFLESGSLADAEAVQAQRSARREGFAAHVTSERLLQRVFSQAGALHPAVRVGVIQEGALASVVAWNTDHPSFWPEHDLLRGLAMGGTTSAIHAMFVAGRRIGRIGDVARNVMESDDYREARLEATERLTHLLGADVA
jgi:5-methylthioadenosine/S-adenosylhomocysteine deaminase